MTKLKYAGQLAEKAGLIFNENIKVEYDKKVSLPKLKKMYEAGLIEDWRLAAKYMDEREIGKLRNEIETWSYREGERGKSSTDLLGVYFPKKGKIIIYETLCLLTARELHVSPEVLVNVVLAHEEAHAVTHLGVDGDSKIWEYFTSASNRDKELYAQLYPWLIFEELSPEMEAFLCLSDKQSSIYQNWEKQKNLAVDAINEKFYEIRHQVPIRRKAKNKLIKQKIVEYAIGSKLDEINAILEDGYEISDITPILQVSGGGIYSRANGLYTLKALFILSEAERRTNVALRLVNIAKDHLQSLNQIVKEENENGYSLFKIIPNNAFLNPEAHAGIGKGTYGFCLFFIKDIPDI